jgi:hypothetical protein
MNNFIDVFDENIQYLTATLGQQKGKIVQYSSKIHELLNYDSSEF